MANYLVPMDFSKEAYLALDWTAKLAKQSKESAIYLLTVGPVSQTTARESEIRALLQQEIVDLRKNLADNLNLFAFYRTGHIPEEIRDFCQSEHIDLVVMTTRGRFGQSRELEGSITEETVRMVGCPILVLHMNQTTADDAHKRFEGFLPMKDEHPPF